MATATATASDNARAVWQGFPIENAWGDHPSASQILVAVEERIALGFRDVLHELGKLRAEFAAAHTSPPESE